METNEMEVLTFEQLNYLTSCVSANTIVIQLEHMLDTDRENILSKVEEYKNGSVGGIATIKEIEDVISYISSAKSECQEARYCAEEASTQACSSEEYAGAAESRIDDAEQHTYEWQERIKSYKKEQEKNGMVATPIQEVTSD